MDFVDDPRRASRQELIVEWESSCSHEISRFYCTQDDDFSVHAFVALDLYKFSEADRLSSMTENIP